ncbi:MAG: TlyA family RNA methyltransferase [Lachnospiraceae bacterium]|nr:TlyA family RNA methyltransferase [Lachnospiraceae bacterium]
MTKVRLDKKIVELYPDLSREKAKALIMAGDVFVDGQREDKAGTNIRDDAVVEIRGKKNPFVSRGGYKIQKAFEVFDISVEGLVCADAGASTGGFTDCMLQHGAVKVYAIDVGYGQLDWKLRNDPRVVCMEKTNVRYVTPEQFGEKIAFSSADLSFISLTKVLPAIFDYLSEDGQAVVLVKPQFEAGREKVGKKGVVRDPSVHIQVITDVSAFASETGFYTAGLTFSPIKGPEGNIEYLLWLKKGTGPSVTPERAAEVVGEAFESLN